MANKSYFLFVLAIYMITFYCEAKRHISPHRDVCNQHDLRCSGQSINRKAIISTQKFQAVASKIITGAVAKNNTNSQIINCMEYCDNAIGELKDCDVLLWNATDAWDKTSKWNKTETWRKDSVLDATATAIDFVKHACTDDFKKAGYALPDVYTAANAEAVSFMTMEQDTANNLITTD